MAVSVIRTRNWTGILYPDSAPDNWREIIKNEIIVPIYVSPLHHGWTGSELDEDKKDHYHVVIAFDGPKTKEQAVEILSMFGVVMVKKVESMRGICRYLCHLDDPDKEQFGENYLSKITVYHTSIDEYFTICEMSEDRLDCISQMLDFIDEQNIVSFYELLTYAKYNNRSWFKSLSTNSAYVISCALKSRRYDIAHSDDYEQ